MRTSPRIPTRSSWSDIPLESRSHYQYGYSTRFEPFWPHRALQHDEPKRGRFAQTRTAQRSVKAFVGPHADWLAPAVWKSGTTTLNAALSRLTRPSLSKGAACECRSSAARPGGVPTESLGTGHLRLQEAPPCKTLPPPVPAAGPLVGGRARPLSLGRAHGLPSRSVPARPTFSLPLWASCSTMAAVHAHS